MKITEIPNYIDPDSFLTFGSEAKYPCSTDRMTYNPLTHKYYLTVEALQDFGIDLDSDFTAGSANKVRQFIDEVTEDIYGVIQHLAPFNYEYNCYLVAQSRSIQYDKYTARKQFEKALLYQAQYKISNIDIRDVNGVDIETGNVVYHKTLRKELRHVSQKSLTIMQGLGLLFNGNVPNKYLINYKEMM